MGVSAEGDGDSVPALIIGAGPAGLASAACLKQRGIDALVLEAAPALAHAWRNHYDRLRLHTVKERSHLPGMPFAKELPRYPARADVVAILRPTRRGSASRPARASRCAACGRRTPVPTKHPRRRPWPPSWRLDPDAGAQQKRGPRPYIGGNRGFQSILPILRSREARPDIQCVAPRLAESAASTTQDLKENRRS